MKALEEARAPPSAGELVEAVRLLRALHEPWRPIARITASRLVVAGDTHGYPEVTRWASGLALDWGADALVLLGDLVDRGPSGAGNLVEAARAAEEGLDVLVVRGDHEILLMNAHYGFLDEVEELYPDDKARVLDEVEAFYASLPLAAEASPLLLVHGGIPCRRCLLAPEQPYTLEEIEEEVRGELADEEARREGEGRVTTQLLWNDPRGVIDWFLPNTARGRGAYYYGREAWKSFLEENELHAIIRGHEVYDGIHAWLPNGGQRHPLPEGPLDLQALAGSVVTVFSSLYHNGRAAALLLDLNRCHAEVKYYKPPQGSTGG